MVKVSQVGTRVNNAMKLCIDVSFSTGDNIELHIEPDQTLEKVLATVEKFRKQVFRINDKEIQRKNKRELFNELMQLRGNNDSHGNIILQNERMIEIVKLIPNSFHYLPENIRVGTTIQLRGVN